MSDVITGNTTEKTTKKVKPVVENPEGTIALNAALLMLEGKSEIKKMGLRIAAVRDGFKSECVGKGKEKFLLDAVKFEDWIKKTIETIPEGYELISTAGKKLNITYAYVFQLIEKHKIKTKKGGGGKGKIYVDFPALQSIFNQKKIRKN
jgi:hypothetical protein